VRADRKNRILSKLREIASFGFENGWISPDGYRNSKVCLAPVGNDSFEVSNEKRALTPEEYKKFIATFVDGDRYKVLFETFFYLGARCGEMKGLQWKDYDPAAKEILIHQQNECFASKRKWIISPTKTKASQRHIKLSDFICGERNDLKATYGGNAENFMFFGPKAITKHPIVEQLHCHCAMAGVPSISPHEIRHTAASWLIGNCKDMSDLIVAQRRLWHSSLKETLDTYSHYLKSGPGIESVMAGIQGEK
jgi:integrase